MPQNYGVVSGMAFNRRESYYEKTTFGSTDLYGMATMNKTIMTFLFCIAFLTLASSIHAQSIEQISYQQFTKFSINGDISVITLKDLDSDWNYLKEALGEPADEECSDGVAFIGMLPTCRFYYDGLEIKYSSSDGDVNLSSMKLTNANYYLQYEDVEIKVGDPTSELEAVFPEAYNGRGPVHAPSGVTNYYIRLNIEGGGSNISFRYNHETQIITEISYIQILT
jgi:hypothetical protein